MLQIPCEKVFRHPKPIPKPLAEGFGACHGMSRLLQVELKSYVPWSKVAILGMVIPPLIGNPYYRYINPYYWVDDHPLVYGNNGSLDPGTYTILRRRCLLSTLRLGLGG